jgi:ribosome maturation factor RimP
MATTVREQVLSLVEPTIERLGFELVDVEFVPGRNAVLRFFIDRTDRPEGVDVDDCAAVSHEVSAVLDVEDPVPQAYSLEVSSPGFDRVLRKRAHFERFVGERVWIELLAPREGRKRYTGKLLAADATEIAIEVDRQTVTIAYADIAKARLAPLA